MMPVRMITLSAVAFAASLGAADAALLTTVPQTVSVSTATTNFTTPVTINKFNPILGALQSVKFTLGGSVSGVYKYESLDAASSSITANLSATITLTRPDLTTLVVTIPVFSATSPAGPFDGSIDFLGSSGATSPTVSATSSNAVTTSTAADITLFTGPGTIALPVLAGGSSTASGSGNLITQFNTSAGATVTVVYTYLTTDVPEPVSLAILGGGLIVLGAVRRRG